MLNTHILITNKVIITILMSKYMFLDQRTYLLYFKLHISMVKAAILDLKMADIYNLKSSYIGEEDF
jgi:hypothetical protein